MLVASFECVYRTTKQLFAIVTIFYGYIDGFQINTQRKMTKVILFKPELNWSLVRLSVPPHGSLAVLVSNTISAFALAVRCPLPSCVPQSIDSLIVTFWLQLQLCKPFAMITFGNEMWAPVSCVVLWITSSSILHDGRTHTHTHTFGCNLLPVQIPIYTFENFVQKTKIKQITNNKYNSQEFCTSLRPRLETARPRYSVSLLDLFANRIASHFGLHWGRRFWLSKFCHIETLPHSKCSAHSEPKQQ